MKRLIPFLTALLLLCACGQRHEAVEPLKKAQADALCKEAFLHRYKDPAHGAAMADSALRYIADSLPAYADGEARALNIRAFCLYLLSEEAEPLEMEDCPEIEHTLAQLLQARWAQRHCQTALSYSILTDIERSGVLDRNRDNYLYAYAQSEYYIVQLLLNYHYRNGSLIDGRRLLEEIEQRRGSLRVDYAQDMALNYAMAYSYFCLAEEEPDTATQAALVGRTYGLLLENLAILARPAHYSTYDLALTVEMMNFLAYSDDLGQMHWDQFAPTWDSIAGILVHTFGFTPADGLHPNLPEESARLFLQLDDPYQRIGGCAGAASFMLRQHGDWDPEPAHRLYAAVLDEAMEHYGFAPKIELQFYEGLVRADYPGTQEDYDEWFGRIDELRTYIAENQSADFQMQLQLEATQRQSHRILLVAAIISLLTLALAVALLLLRRRTRALAREKRLLEEAKKADVERIANVETCLSVLRHDITPFISYLQNEHLPEPLRREVVSQLARTFDNIKSWTTLSAPSGLKFHVEHVPINELFAEVQSQVVNLHPEAVLLHFLPTPLRLLGDRQLLVILLRNLVTNALQHTAAGHVEVSAAPHADDPRFVCLTIADTGGGMSRDELEELFRSDKRPSESGHGFGLILCRNIIKQHDDHTLRGCRIWAESRPAEGTQFHLLLPLAPTEK